MILYHFCAKRHVRQILRQGIAVGSLLEPSKAGYYIHSGWMWLTLDPDPKNQSWATNNRIPYSRTAWRLTVELPDGELDKLYDREKLTSRYPACDLLFKGWTGSENWRVYHGVIPKEFIVEAVEVKKVER